MYYVIQVQGGKEDKVIEEIAKQNHPSVVLDAFAPKRKAKRKYKDGWKEVTVKCFPGYLFVETDDNSYFLQIDKIKDAYGINSTF